MNIYRFTHRSGKVFRKYLSYSTISDKTQPIDVDKSTIKSVTANDTLKANILKDYASWHWDDTVTADNPEVQRLKRELLAGSRSALASAITLVESRNATKRAQGNQLLGELLKVEREKFSQLGSKSYIFRIGISGSPGVGKSSFIEAIGYELAERRNRRVAVLTVDPTSQTTGGSILGDLTRMQELSRHPNAYIRQSPSSGSIGGVTRGIHEAVILCEAAGYDIVLIETVGVGQSEVSVGDMVDMFVLLVSPTGGDELQGVKRGIIESGDLFVVTKADGDLESQAKMAQAELVSALKFMRPRSQLWRPKVMRASIHHPETISAVWSAMDEFWNKSTSSGLLYSRRNDQLHAWMWNYIKDEIVAVFRRHPDIVRQVPDLEADIRRGLITPGLAAEKLLRTFVGLQS